MRVREIVEILDADVLAQEAKVDTTEVKSAFASDMMSDVLAFVNDQGLLLSGLVNPQVVRTAEMMDIPCIVFVRGKKPDKSIIDLAEGKGMILLSTPLRMYEACGKLYQKGLLSDK